MKKCFKCGIEKELSEFYKHKQMGDGHLNKCKICTKKDVHRHRDENIDRIREYDKSRSKLPHRVEARKDYSKTTDGIAARKKARDKFAKENPHKISESQKRYRETYPEKYKAHNCLSNAMRDEKVIRPQFCEVCGCECTPHGHHWSYEEENWLDVLWVCTNCHVDIHVEMRVN